MVGVVLAVRGAVAATAGAPVGTEDSAAVVAVAAAAAEEQLAVRPEAAVGPGNITIITKAMRRPASVV